MLFNSFSFLLFFPIVVILYFLFPKKYRWIWLLVTSYYFYMCWNAAYAGLLFASTFITYLSGNLISRQKTIKRRKVIVAFSFIINLGILAYFKYFVFLVSQINSLIKTFNIGFTIRTFDILLPVGISFYIFQALSYTMDVYRGEIEPEKNFFRYALFVSFFPQLVAGPIERSKNLLKQLRKPTSFSYENLRRGFLMMLWGYFIKLVIADNAAVIVNTIFDDLDIYGGSYIIVGVVLFAFQIYGDFGGYSLIAIGAAKILGFDLMANFNAPYFSKSVSEFWRRWHISLSTWFRDYLYIPLGGNRKGEIRKRINLMIVFLVSGFWHGAAWHFVAWGGLNGLFQVTGDIAGKRKRNLSKLSVPVKDAVSVRILKTVITFILIDFCWLFFRANSLTQAKEAIVSVLTVNNYYALVDGSLFNLGLHEKQVHLLLFSIALLMFIDFLKYKKINIIEGVMQQPLWARDILYVCLVLSVLIFGRWGAGYNESAFIYFQF